MRWIKGLLLGLGLVGCLLLGGVARAADWHQTATPTPTLFVHGYGGSAASSDAMIASLERAGVAERTLRLTVDRAGHLHARGDLHSPNPLVQVVFEESRAGEEVDTQWLLQIYRYLRDRYGVKAVNAVGHSLGAVAVIAAAMAHPAVRMAKLAVIAGPYNGIMPVEDPPHAVTLDKQGRPSQEPVIYQWLDARRHGFAAAAVLNLYGDVGDGSDSDTRVTTQSARSLRGLLRDWSGDYRAQRVRGRAAQHSLLHQRNATVDRALRTFLFGP
ncbi:alpha/beta fold hydrolase [Lacticaseibacillus absianus]|uniref:alpha/beta fold hydrolase n=1 Tax=Lacticaseibacillus absianus TaxID=2729623 RepID=UPI0015CB7A4E|nr:alpha/beta fold hydrolase [Lacticaseibacillus absianus]